MKRLPPGPWFMFAGALLAFFAVCMWASGQNFGGVGNAVTGGAAVLFGAIVGGLVDILVAN